MAKLDRAVQYSIWRQHLVNIASHNLNSAVARQML